MKKKLIIVAFLFLVFSLAAEEKKIDYSIKIPVEKNKNWLGFNPYYPVQHLYTDIIYRFDLEPVLSLEQKKEILSKILLNISYDPIVLSFKAYHKGEDLVFNIALAENREKLIVVSNFDLNEGLIIKEYNNKMAPYVRIYWLLGSLFIPAENFQNPRKEAELIEKDNLNNIANFYLFDNKEENDTLILPMLNKHLEKAESKREAFIGYLTFIQYCLSIGDWERAQHYIDEGRKISQKYPEEIGEWKHFLSITNEIFKITQSISDK